MRDGDAAFVPVGSPVFTVGYRPSSVGRSPPGPPAPHEADTAVGAPRAYLDLAGKVPHLTVNSGRSELARVKDRARVAELVRQVLAAPVLPTAAGPRTAPASSSST